jgi:hypothetical protein
MDRGGGVARRPGTSADAAKGVAVCYNERWRLLQGGVYVCYKDDGVCYNW